jgi:hypothetical protein
MNKTNPSHLFFKRTIGNVGQIDDNNHQTNSRVFDSASLMVNRAIQGNPTTTEVNVSYNQNHPLTRGQASEPKEVPQASSSLPNSVINKIPATESDQDKIIEKIAGKSVNTMSYEDIFSAYKIFLRRLPEATSVVLDRVGMPRERLLSSFMMSEEFLQHPSHIKILFEVAKLLNSKLASSNSNQAKAK